MMNRSHLTLRGGAAPSKTAKGAGVALASDRGRDRVIIENEMAIERADPKMPWQRFRVGEPSADPEQPERTCSSLRIVFHIAHLEAAHRIIVDGKIRSGLIFDESKLNRERILVAWLSPNTWFHGYRYGSVCFDFDWPRLAKDHRYYWVESIAYGVPACRILLTKNDYSGHPILIPYDPTTGDGPWWLDEASNTHYFNGKYCLEFMVERDIEISELWDLDFVKHHSHQCSIDPKSCPERGMSHNDAATKFLARLVGAKVVLPDSIRRNNSSRWRKYAAALASIATGQVRRTVTFDGVLTPGDPSSLPVARALLNMFATPSLHDEIPDIARLFSSSDDVRELFTVLIKELFAP